MKMGAAVILGVGLVMGTVAQAGTYIYDYNVSNWYTAGEVSGITGGSGNLVWNSSSAACIDAVKLSGGGMVYMNDFGGAKWTAPAGEVVTGVTISGSYRDDYHTAVQHMGVAVLGTTYFGWPTTRYLSFWSSSGYDQNNTYSYQNLSVSIPLADRINQLQLRSWEHQAGSPIAINPWGGTISYVRIDTQPDPMAGQTTVYTYTTGTSSWYTTENFTGTTGGTGNIYWDSSTANSIEVIKLYGGGMVYLDDFGGAEWNAPAGQVVTNVKISGSFRDDYHTSAQHMGCAVLGGTYGGYPMDRFLDYWSSTGYDQNNIHAYQNLSADIPISNRVTKLQFRSWEHQAGGAIAVNPWGGAITSVQITTRSVPQWELEVTRGHRLLVTKGLQIQAMIFPRLEDNWVWVGFNPSQFAASNFTSMNFWNLGSTVDPTDIANCIGLGPGTTPWGRTADLAHELCAWEQPYLSNMLDFQYWGDDKVDLANSTNIQSMRNWYALNRRRYPDVINHDDQSPGKSWSTYTNIRNYVLTAQPDMLMFCDYPFVGDVLGNSPKDWYEKLFKYRRHGLEGLDGNGNQPIPYAVFLQTWKESGHTPSESELWLNQFSPWTFGYKFVSAYTYMTPMSSDPNYSILFNGYGDSTPTTKFYQIAEVNRQSRNLGPALVRLISTDVRFIRGQHEEKSWIIWPVWYEWVTVNNAVPSGMTSGISGADSYLTGVSATNTSGSNDNLPGDVLVGFFKPLHESYDGSSYSNQTYFMVTNGLIHQTSDSLATQAHQRIRLNFNFGSSGITSLLRIRRSDGQVEVVNLVSDGGSLYHLDLELDGGQGDLFKYNTGAPFVGTSGSL